METIEVRSIDDMPYAAERIITYLDDYNVVAFYGPMGAGKTTLIRELAARLGVGDTVTSPTFALVNQYSVSGGDTTINHFDFYRIDKVEEAFDLGYEEYFYGGDLCFIEWPEKIEELLPEETLRVIITPDDDQRRVITIRKPVK